MTIEVGVVYVHDGYASVATMACDVFSAVGTLWNTCMAQPAQAHFRVHTASVDGRPTHSQWGQVLVPQASLAQLGHLDVIYVPDAGADIDVMLERHAPLIPWLRERHAAGARVASVCSGVALVAEAGLLDGRRGTTHWAMGELLAQRYPRVDWQIESLVTEDGGVYCGGGVYACVDLSLYLVEQLCGRESAINTARSLLLDMPRTHQPSFAMAPVSSLHSDEAILRVQAQLQQRFREDVRIDEIAAQVGMSGRTLERRFQAATGNKPRAYVQKLRITEARRLLEEGARSVESVANLVGYNDLQHFRSVFKRHTGHTPAAYRASFAMAPASVLRGR